MNEQFGLLYAVPSFTEGLARVLDIGDTLTEYNTSETGEDADRHALSADWRAVGDDLRRAIAAFRQEQQTLSHNG